MIKETHCENNVVLREITKCSLDQKKAVREVRNQDSVRKSMYTCHMISLDEHLAWIDRLQTDKKQIVFVVLINDVAGGAMSINALDRLHKKSDWSFFLDENMRGGLGASLEFFLIGFAFEDLLLEKLNCEVIETNPSVVKLHKKFGFVEEGFRRSNIEKNGKRVGVYFLGLTKEDWLKQRDKIYSQHKRVIDKFNITIEKP